MEPSHRLRAAIVLLRTGKPGEARADAQAALALADNESERREAERMLEAVAKAEAAMAGRSAPASTAPPAGPPSASSTPSTASTSTSSSTTATAPAAAPRRVEPPADLNALNTACQSGDSGACAKLLPFIESECAQKNGSACRVAGVLHERGRGVATNAAIAASFYNQACEAGEKTGCVGFAVLQANGNGVMPNESKARATLNQLCTDGVAEGCVQLAVLTMNGRTAADLARGRELLTKACDARHERACAMLKQMPK
jgi:TPR repeat protein